MRQWRRAALDGWPPLGRPPEHDERVRLSVLRRVRRLLRKYGWSLGEPRAVKLLPGVPRGLLREALRLWKARGRSRQRDRERRLRRSMEVHYRDGVWALDATELGRDERGKKIHGLVVRDVATTAVRAAVTTTTVTAADVLAVLVLAWKEGGRLPLVLMTDNGAGMVAGVIRDSLRRMRIVHLVNLPHTPEHNPFAERAIGELKAESGLDGRTRVRDPVEAGVRLAEARERIDGTWPRLTRGGKTARALDRERPVGEDEIDRTALNEAVRRATEEAAQDTTDGRTRRKRVREATLATLEEFALVTRTGGESEGRA